MKKQKLLLGLFVLFIIALPLLLRLFSYNFTLPGDDIYAYLIQEKAPDENLPIIGQILSHLPYFVTLFLPLIMVLLSLFLIVCILKKLDFKGLFLFVFVLVFALSPLTQSAAFFAGSNTFVLPLFLLGLLLMLNKRIFLGAIPLVLASFVSPAHALINILVVFSLKKYWFKNKRQELNILLGLIGILFLVHVKSFIFSLSQFNFEYLFVSFFSEFGSSFGFGIFELFLAGFGFVLLLSHKKKYYSLFFILAVVLVFSFFLPRLRIYSLLIICFFNMFIICKLVSYKWFIKGLKNLVLLTIFCGLLFTSISHAVAISDSSPSLEFVQSLMILSQKKPGKVLTSQDYANFIEFYSAKKPLIGHEEVSSGFFSDYLNMLYSSDISETIELMKKYYVKYIIVTPEMKSRLWSRDDQGLIYLLGHSKYFKRIIQNNKVKVWEVDYAQEV